MEDPLCNSSFGSMVSLDYVTPDTLTSLRTRCFVWEAYVLYQSKHGMVSGDMISQRFGSNRREIDGIRMERFPRIHYVGKSRRDSKDDDGTKV